MASGGPGDHWITDLTSWDRPVLGEAGDGLLLEILGLGGGSSLEDDTALGRRVGAVWSRRQRAGRLLGARHRRDADAAARDLAPELRALRDRLHAEAIARGWEVD